ncbi:hypothetical protein GJ654_18845 [Rhodoblastus acidophilus]|uniref:Uncharacterized protein n=1 Tax=Rhodoblastus acidophilus TaxID=1074 RepID=A0A6N8DQZ5_RHOAC|nr:hypothetical protein [Rhodoblastus acidophilus]MCW2276387.1 hypothetical protein [Rhodoblastus acidophilus]MTV33042.1 hypothetical protein [Rhodoblastus acidophilus]
MKYVPPLGSTDLEASYVQGNAAVGLAGSIPTARGFEVVQREIVNAILLDGLTPNDADLTQLRQLFGARLKKSGGIVTGLLTLQGGLMVTGRAITSNDTLDSDDYSGTIQATGSATGQTFHLPTPASSGGARFRWINGSSANWNLTTSAGQIVNTTWTGVTMVSRPGTVMDFECDGASWLLVAGNGLAAGSCGFRMFGAPADIPSGILTNLTGWPSMTISGISGSVDQSAGNFNAAAGDAGDWIFTAGANTNGASNNERILIFQNSAAIANQALSVSGTPIANLDPNCCSGVIRVSAGDTVYAKYYHDAGSTQAMGNNSINFFSGFRVGI